MSIERLLDQIRVRFDPQTARQLVSAFRAESLVWHFLESTADLEQWLTFASDDLFRWQPGVLALFSLDHFLPEQDLTNLDIELPLEIHDRVASVFEMTRLTGLEPTSLADAALPAVPQPQATCCYAQSDKHWTIDPQGIAWEHFHTLGEIPMFREAAPAPGAKAACCAPSAQGAQAGACC